MMGLFDVTTALVALTLTTPSSAGPKEKLIEALQAKRAGDCTTAAAIIAPLLEHPDDLPDEDRATAYKIGNVCEFRLTHDATAYAYALKGTALAGASDFLWGARLWQEVEDKRRTAALLTVEAMAAQHPGALNAVKPYRLWSLKRMFAQAGEKAEERRLLSILSGDAYEPSGIANGHDYFRVAYARTLVADGRRDVARQLLGTLRSTSVLIDLSLDKELRSLLAPGIDLPKVAEAELTQHLAAMTAQPDKLAPRLAVALDLRRLDRPDEAINVLK